MPESPRRRDVGRRVVPIAVLLASNVALGWTWGYRAAGAYVLFWLLAALVALAARVFVTRWWPPSSEGDVVATFVRTAVIALAIVVGSGLLLGAIGRIGQLSFLAMETCVLAFALVKRGHESFSDHDAAKKTPRSFRVFPWTAGIAGALLAFAIGFGIAHLSQTLYDSLSYHLFFAARWLQDRAISIIPTPFSDEAQAYAPGNGELFFLWLMLPFHGDLLARVGQFPFALLGGAALYALARRLGAPPAHAVYPPVFFLLSRPVLEQTLGANVDLICAALFITSLYLGLVAAERNRRSDWALWGVSVGLYAGTKYLALIYLPALAALALFACPRARMLWAMPGVAGFALPWYLRNWIVAGSPVYPAGLRIAGIDIARGAFDRAAMLNTVFHTNDPRLLPAIAAHALGPTLLVVWLPVALLGGVELLRRRQWPHVIVGLMPYVMLPLYWFGLPVNVDSRFLMPAIAPAVVPFAFAFGRERVRNGLTHAYYALAMAWILVGTPRELPGRVPWFMQGWLSLAGLVKPEFLGWFAVCAIAIGTLWWFASRRRWALPAAVASIAVSATVVAIGGERWCVPSRCEYIDATSPHLRMDEVFAWRWIGDHARNATVAYTGINLPYPLTGPRLSNRVVYVNIDGRPAWRFHDYDHAVRAGSFQPASPALATASGELLPVRGPGSTLLAGGRAVRPRYERMEGIRDGWIDNLKALRVDYLVVSVLSPYEIENVWHNEQGFPIEDAWASTDPDEFQLQYENRHVRIFAVDLREDAQ